MSLLEFTEGSPIKKEWTCDGWKILSDDGELCETSKAILRIVKNIRGEKKKAKVVFSLERELFTKNDDMEESEGIENASEEDFKTIEEAEVMFENEKNWWKELNRLSKINVFFDDHKYFWKKVKGRWEKWN